MARERRPKDRPSAQQIMKAIGLDHGLDPDLQNEEADILTQKAEAAANEYDFDLASTLYRHAIVASGGSDDQICAYVEHLIDRVGQTEEAIQLLSLPGCTASTKAVRWLTIALVASGRYSEAVPLLEELVSTEGQAEDRLRLATSLLRTGQAARAASEVETASSLGLSGHEWERLQKDVFEQASAQLAPAMARIRQLLLSDQIEAAADATASLESSPWKPQEYRRLAAEVQGRLSSRNSASAAVLAQDALLRGDIESAQKYAQQSLDAMPENAQASAILAQVRTMRAEAERNTLDIQALALWQAGDISQALSAWLRVQHNYSTRPSTLPPDAALHWQFAVALSEWAGKVPTPSQIALIEVLVNLKAACDSSDANEMERWLNRLGSALEGFPLAAELVERTRMARTGRAVDQARVLLDQATAASEAGRLSEALAMLRQAALVPELPELQAVNNRISELELLANTQASARAAFSSLMRSSNQQDYFDVIRQYRANEGQLETLPEAREAFENALAGVASRWPIAVHQPVHKPRLTTDYRSEADGIQDLQLDRLRILSTSPAGNLVFVLSGQKMFALDAHDLNLRWTAELPLPTPAESSPAVITLMDHSPPSSTLMTALDLGAEQAQVYAAHANGIELQTVFSLARSLPKSKAPATRWFALSAAERRVLVTHVPQAGKGEPRLAAFSLDDGRVVTEEIPPFVASNLRRIPGTRDLFVLSRVPDGPLLNHPLWFSMAVVDEKFKLTSKYNLQPKQLDNVIYEAARWIRIGSKTNRIYMLFSYYDMMTGQPHTRPLGFLAMDRTGALVYATSDSSLLLSQEGDLEPTGELLEHEGKEYMAAVFRSDRDQGLAVIDLSGFRCIRRWTCEADERLLTVVRGSGTSDFVCISFDEKHGALRMRHHSIFE